MAREKGLLIEQESSAGWTESERIRQLELIRQMPVSMQLRRHLRLRICGGRDVFACCENYTSVLPSGAVIYATSSVRQSLCNLP
ncbi:hypothetical protein NP493_1818g00028 [Ridgeia piscesae]|uniref:Uncharacterized protein n=1 Tax=Ridgeia piscesae TaxID=27915 RepID=A0AAD9N8L9_RIDPI|nr:hypothetical protein NP493_1818g00028 [Ridgeia piscesae]